VELGGYIQLCDERNNQGEYTLEDVRGISTEKKFIDTKANLDGVPLTAYKVVNSFEFVYVADTSRRGDKIALALNTSDKSVLISSIYTTFRLIDTEQLFPEYLFLLLSREEFDRYARFNSWGSARETFDWSELCRVRIPLPPPEVQQAIVNLYNCAEEAKNIANEAREKMKTLCPALVQRAINK
jgi:type I restriction enzyme S subunit